VKTALNLLSLIAAVLIGGVLGLLCLAADFIKECFARA
jgi:hypothetical protein